MKLNPVNTSNLVYVLRDALLYNSVYCARPEDVETPDKAICRTEKACSEIMKRVECADLQEEIENAYAECLAAYECSGFQRGIQAGAQLMLELLGKGPYKEG